MYKCTSTTTIHFCHEHQVQWPYNQWAMHRAAICFLNYILKMNYCEQMDSTAHTSRSNSNCTPTSSGMQEIQGHSVHIHILKLHKQWLWEERRNFKIYRSGYTKKLHKICKILTHKSTLQELTHNKLIIAPTSPRIVLLQKRKITKVAIPQECESKIKAKKLTP